MARVAIEELKTRFEHGDTPTAQDFIDLIETIEDATALNMESSSRESADIAINSLLSSKADKSTTYTKTETKGLIAAGSVGVPAGFEFRAQGISSAPSGYLYCDGSAILKESYPALYAAIGDTHSYLAELGMDNPQPWRNQYL